jgi:hypothetical protein
MWKCWEEEGCIYRVLIGGNKIWNLLKKKKFPAGTTVSGFGGYGYGFDLMWTGGKIFEIWKSRVRGREYGYAGTGTRARVCGHGYNGFFPKKHWPALLKPVPVYPLPAYTRARVRVQRVHGYGLYPAGFSNPLALADSYLGSALGSRYYEKDSLIMFVSKVDM